uniref:Putative conserved plasma membrane protein n=1 Tax=Ixodes ricinus TaxID=34613 RepID=A0A090XCP1_IXORI
MKYVLLIALATLGALGILVVSIYLLRRARIMNCEGAKSFRYIRLTPKQRARDGKPVPRRRLDRRGRRRRRRRELTSPATVDVESRTASVVKANGQSAYRRSSAVAENETDEELLQ